MFQNERGNLTLLKIHDSRCNKVGAHILKHAHAFFDSIEMLCFNWLQNRLILSQPLSREESCHKCKIIKVI